MNYLFSKLDKCKMDDVLKLTEAWENEKITYGLVAGSSEDYANMDIWICTDQSEVIAYAAGNKYENDLCVFSEKAYFELEEIYVKPAYRNRGIGTKLFHYVENEIKASGIGQILLSSANKDFDRTVRFYQKLGMHTWTVSFFKTL